MMELDVVLTKEDFRRLQVEKKITIKRVLEGGTVLHLKIRRKV